MLFPFISVFSVCLMNFWKYRVSNCTVDKNINSSRYWKRNVFFYFFSFFLNQKAWGKSESPWKLQWQFCLTADYGLKSSVSGQPCPYNLYDMWILFNKMVTNKIPRLENHHLEWIWGPSLGQNPSFASLGDVQKLWGKFSCLCCVCVQGDVNRCLSTSQLLVSWNWGSGLTTLCLMSTTSSNETQRGNFKWNFIRKKRNVWIQKTGKRDGRLPNLLQYIFHKLLIPFY